MPGVIFLRIEVTVRIRKDYIIGNQGVQNVLEMRIKKTITEIKNGNEGYIIFRNIILVDEV